MGGYDLAICGWRVRSALFLPGIAPWAGSDAAAVDLHITRGAVPASLPGEVVTGRYMRIGTDGRVLFDVPGIGAYLIEAPDRVVVSPHADADPQDVVTFFKGAVFGMLCHLHGRLPLHASSVEVEGRALVFAGEPGAGKSTLAAAMAAKGFRLLADDVSVVVRVDGAPWVAPASRLQKLWQDSQEALGLPAGRSLRTVQDRFKYEHQAGVFLADPVPLGAVFHLSRAPDRSEAILERQAPGQAFHTVWTNIYRDHAARTLGLAGSLFVNCGWVAGSVPCFTLRRSDDFGGLDALTDVVAAALERPA